jgi:hypothetical protein
MNDKFTMCGKVVKKFEELGRIIKSGADLIVTCMLAIKKKPIEATKCPHIYTW